MNLLPEDINRRSLGLIRQATKLLVRKHPRVLMYHRVLPGNNDSSIPLNIFKKQLQLLKNNFNIFPLQEVINKNQQNHTVALTFDDGYYDFYTYIFPILKQMGMPATVFVTTDFISGRFWFWPDKIRYMLKKCSKKEIYIKQLNKRFFLLKEYFDCWNSLADYAIKLPIESRRVFIEELQQLTGVNLPEEVPEEYKGVTWQQLEEMSASGLIEIGSHGVSHQILTQLTPYQTQVELEQSKKELEERLGKKISGFCYPNGMASDYSQSIQEKMKKTGYEYAVTAYPSIKPLQDLMAINRYPASSNMYNFKNMIYGLRYQALYRLSLKRSLF